MLGVGDGGISRAGSRSAYDRDEVAEFIRDLRRIIHGRGDLMADEFAKPHTQAVNGDFHRSLGQAE